MRRVPRSRWRVWAAIRSIGAPLTAAVVAWPARSEPGVREELPERAPYVVRAERSTVPVREDGPIQRNARKPSPEHHSGELRHRDPTDRRIRLRPALPDSASALVLHHGAGHSDDHPGQGVLDVTRSQRQHLSGTQGRPEQYLDDVAHLAVGLGPQADPARCASWPRPRGWPQSAPA